MKKLVFSFCNPILLAFLLYPGCGSITGSGDPEQYIVDVVGASAVLNCSKSYTLVGHFAIEEPDTISLAVSAGDLIYIQLSGEEIFCYRYRPGDGLLLSVSYDTAYDRLFMNNELISVSLSEGSPAWDWLNGAGEKDLGSIRSFYISLPLSEAEISILEKISRNITYPGLFVEGETGLEEVLAVITPGWLMAEDLDYHTAPDEVRRNLEHLELLWFGAEDTIEEDFLYGLPELSSLIIEQWDSATINGFQFGKLKNLKSLSIIESAIHDLSPLAGSARIKNLNLIYCESLEELGPLSGFSGIASLSLTGCQHIKDIQAIRELPALARLSLPGNISQESFAEILSRQSALQVLELVDCEHITDLSPLVDLPGLRALTLDSPIDDLHPLYQLSDLELLVLSGDYYDDTLVISEIRQALPDTRIVAGGGFCLGAGWILLLVPAVVVLVMARNRLARQRSA